MTIPCTSTTGVPEVPSPPTRACITPAAVSVHSRVSSIATSGPGAGNSLRVPYRDARYCRLSMTDPPSTASPVGRGQGFALLAVWNWRLSSRVHRPRSCSLPAMHRLCHGACSPHQEVARILESNHQSNRTERPVKLTPGEPSAARRTGAAIRARSVARLPAEDLTWSRKENRWRVKAEPRHLVG